MRRLMLAVTFLAMALPAQAHDGVHVNAAYAVVASGKATTAAAFMAIVNHAAEEDILVSATSSAAERVELHSHAEDASGMMVMAEVEGGFAVPPEGTRKLARGGDHLMLVGLTRPLVPGDRIDLQLTFSRGEVIDLILPVQDAAALGEAMEGHDH
jgi:periplasmic copper chaperone A